VERASDGDDASDSANACALSTFAGRLLGASKANMPFTFALPPQEETVGNYRPLSPSSFVRWQEEAEVEAAGWEAAGQCAARQEISWRADECLPHPPSPLPGLLPALLCQRGLTSKKEHAISTGPFVGDICHGVYTLHEGGAGKKMRTNRPESRAAAT